MHDLQGHTGTATVTGEKNFTAFEGLEELITDQSVLTSDGGSELQCRVMATDLGTRLSE
jgi:hypothetical protein